jgi:4-alpha-glucanotransferase
MRTVISGWGVEPGYVDARAQPQTTDPHVIATIESLLGISDDEWRFFDVIVLRGADNTKIAVRNSILTWDLQLENGQSIASGHGDEIRLKQPLDYGTYHLAIIDEDGARRMLLVLVAPRTAYQPPFFSSGKKVWLLTVQLYAIRSAHNWGHGDFTDLIQLLRIAADTGAAGIGVNPLHALAPGQASPYTPSSRSFLNPLYIDVEAIPETAEIDLSDLAPRITQLRASDIIDYAAVDFIKRKALRAVFDVFCRSESGPRHKRFHDFRKACGERLATFAAFEAARDRRDASRQHPKTGPDTDFDREVEFHAFVQWIAHEQLEPCTLLAKRLNLPIGLYLDLAVGVDPDGADTSSEPSAFARDLAIGAPPDIYNPHGQDWGLAAFHPQALIDSNFDLFRRTLRSAMCYAGAIRIDHALGLYRLFLIPTADKTGGGYVRLPFEAMLAVIAQESVNARCLVIGEDLGTIPDGVCDALQDWGLWSYRVALFEREGFERFRSPEEYPANAIVTFNTHDLPTYAGWLSAYDLAVRKRLNLDSFESEFDREHAHKAMRATLSHLGFTPDLSLSNVLRYLARTPARLLAVSIEDILELEDQPNIPATVDSYPNWRRRLPVNLADFPAHAGLSAVSSALGVEERALMSVPSARQESDSEAGVI